MARPPRSYPIVGAEFTTAKAIARRAEIAACRAGEPVSLRPAPGILRDRYGIEVRSARGHQIGYLGEEQARELLPVIDSLKAVFEATDTFGASIRVSFDGSDPVTGQVKPKKRKPSWPPRPPRDEYVDI